MRYVSNIRFASGVSLPYLLSFVPAWAEGSEEKGGLPQLDPSLFPEQLFWLAVSFVLLYLLMAFVALPRVKQTQDKRHTTISKDIEAATLANLEAKSTLTDYEKNLADAHTQARVTVAEIRTRTTKESAQRQSEQQQALSKRLHDAEAAIRMTRDQAIMNIRQDAIDLAHKIVEKIAGVKGSPVSTEEPS